MWMFLACAVGSGALDANPASGLGDTGPTDPTAPPPTDPAEAEVAVACDVSIAHPLPAPSDGWTQEWLTSLVIDEFVIPAEASESCPRVDLTVAGARIAGDCADERTGTVYTGWKEYRREADGSVTVVADAYGWSGEAVTGTANLRAYGDVVVQTTAGWRRSSEDGRRSWCTSAANLLRTVEGARWTYDLAYLYTEEGVGTATVVGSLTIDQDSCSHDPEVDVRLDGERELHLVGGPDCDGCFDWSAGGDTGETCPNDG